jgi:tetratricopeptide (TPR) repeat protein
MTLGVAIALAVIGIPALVFVLWPLRARAGAPSALLPLPPDAREQLEESKRAALRALRELEFEHASGHVGDADYADLRARYEAEAAQIFSELDRLASTQKAVEAPAPAAEVVVRRVGWRHPAALTVAAVALVTFGVALGVGIVRFTEPDTSMASAPGGGGQGPMMAEPSAANAPKGPVTPEMLQGMLAAARQSLYAGRYNEAMRAYQAVLKRDPNNVNALTHLGLMAGIAAQGQHGPEMIERALDLFDRALTLEPDYPPALLYRGQVLYEVRKDLPGAIKSWERFVAVSPPGEDRERVVKMIAEARAQTGARR